MLNVGFAATLGLSTAAILASVREQAGQGPRVLTTVHDARTGASSTERAAVLVKLGK